MASSKEYLHFILEQLSALNDISYRSMMGEYILYYHGKIVGGIYDDRLLVKKTRSALECMPAAVCDFPYAGAKEMLLVEEAVSYTHLDVYKRQALYREDLQPPRFLPALPLCRKGHPGTEGGGILNHISGTHRRSS